MLLFAIMLALSAGIALMYALLGPNGLYGAFIASIFLHVGYRLKHGKWWD